MVMSSIFFWYRVFLVVAARRTSSDFRHVTSRTLGRRCAMGGERKRLRQTFIAPHADTTPSAKPEDECLLPNVDICAKVYAYCEVVSTPVGADAYPQFDAGVHRRPLYVGQTIQELGDRDKQHLRRSESKFDREYKYPSQYVLVILSQRHFAAAERDENFKDETLYPVGAWMDYWEMRYISEFDTFNHGLNSTRGGQGHGWLVTRREAVAKATYVRFVNVYMPAFRAFFSDTGHANATQAHPILGMLMNNIRQGNTQIPPQFEEELSSMGLDVRNQHIVERDKRWEEEYMPAFRAFFSDTGHANATQAHPILGILIRNIRQGNTRIPPQFEEELSSMNLLRCTKNLARHVIRILGREVDSLEDEDARRVVENTAQAHAQLLLRRIKGKIAFGTKPLGDGTARFAADLKRMERVSVSTS